MNNKEKESSCISEHCMYQKLYCELQEGHEGLHRAIYQGELLRWGVPSEKEKYDAVRTK